MTQQPDEDHDVIVYAWRGTWEIWLGDELHGLRFTRESALDRARDVAAVNRKLAWLLDETGYPLKPIGRKSYTESEITLEADRARSSG